MFSFRDHDVDTTLIALEKELGLANGNANGIDFILGF